MSSFKNQKDLESAYPRDKHLWLIPFENLADTLSPYYKVSATVLKIDLDADGPDVYVQEKEKVNKKSGEIFGPAKLSFSKGALEGFAAAAGIRDVPSGCGVQIRQSRLCTFQATGETRMPDGSFRQVSRTYTVDLELFEDRQRAKYLDQAEKIWSGALNWAGPKKEIETLGMAGFVNKKVVDSVNQKRTSLDESAETGAKTRMIRATLKIPNVFTAAEMSKPVLILRIDEDFPLDDPDVKRMIIERGSRSASALYPPPAPATGRSSLSPENSGTKAPAAPIAVAPGAGKTPQENGDTSPPPSRIEVYQNYDISTLRDMFVALVKKKEYPATGELVVKWKATPKDDKQGKVEIVIALEDYEKPAAKEDDDLPF